MRLFADHDRVAAVLDRARDASAALRRGAPLGAAPAGTARDACSLADMADTPQSQPDVIPISPTQRRRRGRRVFVVAKPFVYLQTERFDFIAVVPETYETDFASIPGFIRWLIRPAAPRTRIATLVHDWLYSIGRRGDAAERENADRVFRVAMGACGIDPIRCAIMFYAVRWFGGGPFGRPKEFETRFLDLETLEPIAPAPFEKDVMRQVSVCPALPPERGGGV